MLHYLTHKSTIFSFIADIIILSGVFYLNWNPSRAIAFFCLDIEVMIFFFFIFMKLKKEINDIFSFLLGFLVLSILVYVDFNVLLSIKSNFENVHPKVNPEDLINLFKPYYDVSIFILISGTGHYYLVRDLIRVKKSTSSELFELKWVFYRLLMVPAVFVLAEYFSIIFHTNIYTTPFILFIIVKVFLEYWKFKTLKKLLIKIENI